MYVIDMHLRIVCFATNMVLYLKGIAMHFSWKHKCLSYVCVGPVSNLQCNSKKPDGWCSIIKESIAEILEI